MQHRSLFISLHDVHIRQVYQVPVTSRPKNHQGEKDKKREEPVPVYQCQNPQNENQYEHENVNVEFQSVFKSVALLEQNGVFEYFLVCFLPVDFADELLQLLNGVSHFF